MTPRVVTLSVGVKMEDDQAGLPTVREDGSGDAA